MMEGRVIEYRPSHGGGLDYHNSPLIGEIPATDLYHVHRSIDQLRSLNERNVLHNLSELKTSPPSSSSTPAIHLEYKLYTNGHPAGNNNNSTNNNNNVCPNNNNSSSEEMRPHSQHHSHPHHHHHHQHQHHHPQQQLQSHQQTQPHHHHDNVDYLKHVGEDIVSGGAVVGVDGNVGDVSALIDEQNEKIDSVLKHVEKHEVDSVYQPSAMSPSPPPAAITDGRGRKKGSKKVTKPDSDRLSLCPKFNLCFHLKRRAARRRRKMPSNLQPIISHSIKSLRARYDNELRR